MKRTFEESLLFGQIGENWVCHEAQKAGFMVEKNCAEPVTNGLGPRAYSADGTSLQRPDFIFSKRGTSIDTEIKTKESRTTGIISGEEETGIDYRLWLNYQKYQRTTGRRILLVVPEYIGLADRLIHLPEVQKQFAETGATTLRHPPTAVLAQWIDALKPSLSYPTRCYGKEMIYFAVSQFERDWLSLMEKRVNTRAVSAKNLEG